MPLVSTKANAGAFGLGWSAVLPAEELGGMVLLTPTSIAYTGGGSETATIGANGSVEFSAVTSLSLNGVFSADYDNYMIVMRGTDDGTTGLRLRTGGTDNSTANSYVTQLLSASSTTVSGSRTTTTYSLSAYSLSTNPNGNVISVYAPYLAQPTAGRSINVNNDASARIVDWAWTHNQSTSYDGFTLLATSQIGGTPGTTMTGLISVYGLKGA